MVLNWFWRYNEFRGITLQNKNKKRVGWKYFFIELCSIFIYKVTVAQVILYGKVLMFKNNKNNKTRRKEMFYLMMHSNTFYLWLYGVRHMVQDHSVREETCCCHMGYLFPVSSKGSFICNNPQTG